MPDQVGKIIRINNHFPGPATLTVNTVGEGLRKHINLCFCCRKFQPNEASHCDIAQRLFDLSKEASVATALVRCPNFDPKPGVEVFDAVDGSNAAVRQA